MNRFIAIIPARAGSKRLPGKNIRPLAGKPLVCHTIEAARACAAIEKIIISSDIDVMPRLIEDYRDDRIQHCDRPQDLCGDLVSTEEVLIDVLERVDGGGDFTGVVTLLPTSPFRGTNVIQECIDRFTETGCDAALTVTRQRFKWGQRDDATGRFSLADPDTPAHMHKVRPTFLDNPSTYVTKKSVLVGRKFVLGDDNYGVEIDRTTGLDINDELDWMLAEQVAAKRSNTDAGSGSDIVNLRHTGIVVEDLEESLAFYRDALGFEVVHDQYEKSAYIDKILAERDVDLRFVRVRGPGGQELELLDFRSPKREKLVRRLSDIGITHVAYRVQNVDKIYEQLRTDDIHFNSPPQETPDGFAKVAFCRAPEGTFIEFVEILG